MLVGVTGTDGLTVRPMYQTKHCIQGIFSGTSIGGTVEDPINNDIAEGKVISTGYLLDEFGLNCTSRVHSSIR
jgi:hypothetical protein